MKNKKLTYVLLPLVIIIWGTIFWKFFTGVGNQGVKASISNVRLSDEPIKVEKDTIRLSFQYNDPFLGSFIEAASEQTKVIANPVKLPNIVVPWPNVEYRGTVGKHNEGKPLGLIKFAGKESLISESDVIDNATVLKITPDSVELEYNGDRRSFKRIGL